MGTLVGRGAVPGRCPRTWSRPKIHETGINHRVLNRCHTLLAGLCVAIASAGAACPERLSPRAPARDPRTPTLPETTTSRVTLPVRVDFGPAFAGVEELVPRQIGPSTNWEGVGDGAEVLYEVTRGPIRLAIEGGTLVAEADVRYAIRARKRFLVTLYFQCGCAGEAWCGGSDEGRRRMRLRAETRLRWDPAWHLVGETTIPAPQSQNDCVLGWGPWSRNLTPMIGTTVRRELGEVARGELDERVPLLTSVQSKVARAFAALHQPIALGGELWVVLSPSAIEVSPVGGHGAIASATVSFTTEPRVVRGAQPDARPARLPAPAIGVAASPGFGVAVRSGLSFAVARAHLRESLAGRRFPESGGLEIIGTDLYGSGDRVVLRADVTGAGEGSLYITGRAAFDEAAEAIVLTDLAYTEETLVALRRIADWPARAALLSAVGDAARFSMRAGLSRTRERTIRALTRELAPGIALSVELPAHRVTAVGTDRAGFALAVVLEGTAELTLGAR